MREQLSKKQDWTEAKLLQIRAAEVGDLLSTGSTFQITQRCAGSVLKGITHLDASFPTHLLNNNLHSPQVRIGKTYQERCLYKELTCRIIHYLSEPVSKGLEFLL